jgi:hypothetical protein
LRIIREPRAEMRPKRRVMGTFLHRDSARPNMADRRFKGSDIKGLEPHP